MAGIGVGCDDYPLMSSGYDNEEKYIPMNPINEALVCPADGSEKGDNKG